MIEQDYNKLIKEFIKISKKGWVKGINNTTNSVGLTFESLLGKNPDSMFFPDYHGIEIKCSQRFSRYPLTLFSLSFDGPSFYEMNRLLTTYGKKDVIYKDKFQLQGPIYVNQYSDINGYYFRLKINKKNQKIIVSIYDLNYQLIEEETYIDFNKIKSRLEVKLSQLALVYASKKIIDNDLYFRYYLITIYKLKSFDVFLSLLEEDNIKVSIMGRVSRSGIDKGRQRNKNLVFYIEKEKINLLFDKDKEYNNDLEKSKSIYN